MLDDRVLPSKIIRKKIQTSFLFEFWLHVFFFLLAPEEGLSFKPKYWQICLNIYFLFYSFVHLFIALP